MAGGELACEETPSLEDGVQLDEDCNVLSQIEHDVALGARC